MEGVKWGAGCESVKAEVAGKIAKDLGLGETEVRKTLDSLAGLKDEELEGGLINRLVDEVKQIKDRVETLEGLAGIYRKPEDLGIEFRGDVTYIVFGNVRYPFIDQVSSGNWVVW
ncbi:hypothetical protein [Vulcanisaeta distributa]|uniref:hypothetical protein n=1 Tax=Vulcanisaeta distributa TaxID=164451 RepID=UPI0006CF7BC8|nr:hypothetical protein [Vulcanisaeta distributa]